VIVSGYNQFSFGEVDMTYAVAASKQRKKRKKKQENVILGLGLNFNPNQPNLLLYIVEGVITTETIVSV
jgi:hypothetical protein